MELMVLAVPDCRNAPVLERRLATALAGRPAVTVARRVITDAAQAARWGMHGSPTLLIDGHDPFAAPGVGAALACRLYPTGDGHLDGAPTVAELRRVLEQQSAGTGPPASAPAAAGRVAKAGTACAPGSRAGQAGG
jgi:hypothetical protein